MVSFRTVWISCSALLVISTGCTDNTGKPLMADESGTARTAADDPGGFTLDLPGGDSTGADAGTLEALAPDVNWIDMGVTSPPPAADPAPAAEPDPAADPAPAADPPPPADQPPPPPADNNNNAGNEPPPADPSPPADQPPPEPDLGGTWVGEYDCSQGPTDLTLQLVHNQNDDSLTGDFAFGPTAQNPEVPHGSFSIEGAFEPWTATVQLDPIDWIDLVPDYGMVGVVATYDPFSDTLSGYIDDPNCGDVTLQRR